MKNIRNLFKDIMFDMQELFDPFLRVGVKFYYSWNYQFRASKFSTHTRNMIPGMSQKKGKYKQFVLLVHLQIISLECKVKLPLCLINWVPHHEDLSGSGGIALSFLTSALDEVSCQLNDTAA
jgi:hypothetical protein